MLLTLTSFLLPLWVNCFIQQWLNFFCTFRQSYWLWKKSPSLSAWPGQPTFNCRLHDSADWIVAPCRSAIHSTELCFDVRWIFSTYISLSPHTLALCVSFHLWVRWVIHTHRPPQIDIKWWRSHLPFALFRSLCCLFAGWKTNAVIGFEHVFFITLQTIAIISHSLLSQELADIFSAHNSPPRMLAHSHGSATNIGINLLAVSLMCVW